MSEAEKIQKKYISVEEYFEMEKHSEIRHEYYDGEVFAMAGTSINHNRIVQNLSGVLRPIFRPRGCEVLLESVKLEAIKHFYYPYPDLMLTCDTEDMDAEYIIKKPTLIVEVLLKSSVLNDRVAKLRRYKNIPTLQYYLIVSQYEFLVESYCRVDDSTSWLYDVYEDQNDIINFPKLDLKLALSDIYEGIKMREEDKEKDEDYILNE
nr:Uma2 family endonuclease [uncultured Emticicia sp.]